MAKKTSRQSPTVASGATSPKQFAAHLAERESAPALLVSYVYLEPFLKNRANYHYRDWALDSGAFSAHNIGAEIKLKDYIAACKRLMDEDSKLSEIFALDVIGDWKASIKNCEAMWKAGVPAIPCYHVGEPERELRALARDYPKIALGGAVGFAAKNKWAAQCFARVWPKKIHGFGFGSEKAILALPFHSVDATTWEVGPCRFGKWKAFGGDTVSVRGSKQNLRVEIEWYLKLEERARAQWAKEMAELDAADGVDVRLSVSGFTTQSRYGAPDVHLACSGQGQGEKNGSLEGAPSLRLACAKGQAERNGSLDAPSLRLAMASKTENKRTTTRGR